MQLATTLVIVGLALLLSPFVVDWSTVGKAVEPDLAPGPAPVVTRRRTGLGRKHIAVAIGVVLLLAGGSMLRDRFDSGVAPHLPASDARK